MPFENIRKLLKAIDETKNGEMIGIPKGVLPLLDKLERKLINFQWQKPFSNPEISTNPKKGVVMEYFPLVVIVMLVILWVIFTFYVTHRCF